MRLNNPRNYMPVLFVFCCIGLLFTISECVTVFAKDGFRYTQVSNLPDTPAGYSAYMPPAIISGDGKTVCYAYVDPAKTYNGYIYICDANGKSTQLIDTIAGQCGSLPSGDVSIHLMNISYDGKKILYGATYSTNCTEGTRYFVFDTDSNTKSELLFRVEDTHISDTRSLAPKNQDHITMSGNGKYIFFASTNSWDCVATQTQYYPYWVWECSTNSNENLVIWRVSTDDLSNPESPTIYTEITELEDGATNLSLELPLQTNHEGDVVAVTIESNLVDYPYTRKYGIYVCHDDGVWKKVEEDNESTYEFQQMTLSPDGQWIAYQYASSHINTIHVEDGNEYQFEATDVFYPNNGYLADVNEDASWLLLYTDTLFKVVRNDGKTSLTSRNFISNQSAGTGLTPTLRGCLSDDGNAVVFAAIDGENGLSSPQVYVATTGIVVNTTGDESDADKNDGVVDVDLKKKGIQCTLRAAIEACNSQSLGGTITFDIPITDSGYSDVGTSTFTISPKKPLPVIKKKVTIDATTQSNGNLVLNGKKAGRRTNGLECSLTGKLSIKGMTIKNFGGHGVKARSEEDLAIEDTDVQDNGDIGIFAENNILVNAKPGTPGSVASQEVCKISNNGKGKKGGGIWSKGGYIYAHYVETMNNKGPGIVAEKSITLSSIKANNNKGTGIQAMLGGITINRATEDYSEENEVNDNEGPGILAGTDVSITSKVQSDGDSSGIIANDIEINTHIDVQNNAGWGIFCESGSVSLNKSTGGGYTTVVSSITKNGDKKRKCYFVDDDGNLVSPKSTDDYDVGGIAASGASFEGTHLDVSDNGGPGIVAKTGMTLASIKANRNKGPGLQAMLHGITINRATSDYSEENEVNDNEGPGILAGIDVVMTFESEGDLTDDVANDIDIETHIDVQNNAGWGIFCQTGHVSLNKSTSSGFTTVVSSITKNGDKEKNCYYVDVYGDLVSPTDYDVGGIAANGSYFEGTHLDVSDNGGTGIVAKTGMTLASIKANRNKGPGLQAMRGMITINWATSDYSEENQVNNNEGPGILAGTDVKFDTTVASGGEDYSVGIHSHIEAENNGGWGIFCQKGYVEINVASGMLTALSSKTSSVSGNGNTSLPCYIVDDEGDLTVLTDYDTGGIGASAGGLTAANLEATNNTGAGIEVGGDVVIGTGTVCGNTKDDIISGGTQSLTNVVSGENCN